MKTNKFPKRIYVWMNQDKDEYYMIPDEDIENIDDGQKVGIYELKEMKTITVTRELK